MPRCNSCTDPVLLGFYLTVCWFFPKSNLATAGLDPMGSISQLGIGEAPLNWFGSLSIFKETHETKYMSSKDERAESSGIITHYSL